MNRGPRSSASLSLLLSLALAALLAACGGPAIQGVASVEVLGGDRSVPQGATALLTPHVTAGSGVATTVTWTSSDPAIATVDADGTVTAHLLGTTTVTATSTADLNKSGSVELEVVVPSGAVRATYAGDPAAPPVLGAGLIMADTDAIFIASASMVELENGLYAGPISPIDSEGGVNIQLPPVADIPAALLKPAASLVSIVDSFPDCQLVASQPTVMVTEAVANLLPFLPIPTVILLTADGFYPAAVTDATFEPGVTPVEEVYSHPFVTWVYAAGDVNVQTSGTGCDIAMGIEFAVDVDLVTGWNQLVWTYDWDAVADDIGAIHLSNSTVTELYLNPMAP